MKCAGIRLFAASSAFGLCALTSAGGAVSTLEDLRSALAGDGTEVTIAAGVTIDVSSDGRGPIVLSRAVTLRGENRETSVLTANGRTNCVEIKAANAVLSTLTVRDGIPSNYSTHSPLRGCFYGGGVYMNANGLITNCTVTGCTLTDATRGGYEATLPQTMCRGCGVYLTAGEIVGSTVERCKVDLSGAVSVYGAGLAASGSAHALRCEVVENFAQSGVTGSNAILGGGFYAENALIELCQIGRNEARAVGSTFGGGICLSGGVMTNCLLFCNTNYNASTTANGGNAAFAASSIYCSTFSNNWTSGEGGGFYAKTSTTIEDSLFVGNFAKGSGGGSASYVNAKGCVYRNNSTDANGGGYSINGTGYCVEGCLFEGNASANGGDAVHFKGASSGETLKNCVIRNHTAGHALIAVTKAKDVVIRNNLICGNSSNYVVDYSTQGAGNVFESNSQADNAIATGVFLVDSGKDLAGKMSWTENRVWVVNSLFADNKAAVPANLSTYCASAASNNFAAVTANLPVDGDGNLLNGNVTAASPRFRDAASGNYSLRGKSVCVGAGQARDWMAEAKDLGNGTFAVESVADYGVRLVANKPIARLPAAGHPSIGCYEPRSSGLVLILK